MITNDNQLCPVVISITNVSTITVPIQFLSTTTINNHQNKHPKNHPKPSTSPTMTQQHLHISRLHRVRQRRRRGTTWAPQGSAVIGARGAARWRSSAGAALRWCGVWLGRLGDGGWFRLGLTILLRLVKVG